MKVRVTELKDNPYTYGLTVGNTYEITDHYKFPDGKVAYCVDCDDQGESNELYDGEFEEVK